MVKKKKRSKVAVTSTLKVGRVAPGGVVKEASAETTTVESATDGAEDDEAGAALSTIGTSSAKVVERAPPKPGQVAAGPLARAQLTVKNK
jgi:hypothetical protein